MASYLKASFGNDLHDGKGPKRLQSPFSSELSLQQTMVPPLRQTQYRYRKSHLFLPPSPPPPPPSSFLYYAGCLPATQRQQHRHKSHPKRFTATTFRDFTGFTLMISLFLNMVMFLAFYVFMPTHGDTPSWAASTTNMVGTRMLWQPHASIFYNDNKETPFLMGTSDAKATRSQHHHHKHQQQLPAWILEYTDWHESCRMEIEQNASAWRSYQYLILRCLHRDESCGGLADRLRALPFLLQVAAMTKRLILIYWERPAPLEQFLQPGRLNWTVPHYMVQGGLNFGLLPALTRIQDMKLHQHQPTTFFSKKQVLDARFQAYQQGQLFYDTHKVQLNEPNLEKVFGAVWKLFFQQPTAPIQQILEDFWATYPRRSYDATHARIFYTTTTNNNNNNNNSSNHHNISQTVSNAIACTPGLGKGGGEAAWSTRTVFFASDSMDANRLALEYGSNHKDSLSIVVSPLAGQSPPLHLDRGLDFLTTTKQEQPLRLWNQARIIHNSDENSTSHNYNNQSTTIVNSSTASAYNGIFVDLYLLAGARCLAFDRGGFGKLAALLSGTSCYRKHRVVRHCSDSSDGNTTIARLDAD